MNYSLRRSLTIKIGILMQFLLIVPYFLNAGYFLIWEPADFPSSGTQFWDCLSTLGYSGEYTQFISPCLSHLSDYDEIFIFLGEFPDNYILPAGEIVDSLCLYLDRGGQIYMEGEDTWWFDPPTNLHSYFFIQGNIADEANIIFGIDGTFTEGMIYNYGTTWMTPQITPQGTAFLIFETDSAYSCGVASDTMGYKTVGLSIFFNNLFDSLTSSKRIDLADSIMHFFGNSAGEKEFEKKDIYLVESCIISCSPNPFSQSISIIYQVRGPLKVSLEIYDSSGRKVKTLMKGIANEGRYKVNWDRRDTENVTVLVGTYFVRLKAGDFTSVKKVILVR